MMMRHPLMARPMAGHRHVPHAVGWRCARDSQEHVKRHGVRLVRDLEQRRKLIERRVAADAERESADARDVAHGAGRERADRIDELAGMWTMNDFGEEKNLSLDRRV